MRIVVCVKWVPVLNALKFDPATRRLVREGVPGEVSSFDLRALGGALAQRAPHGGEVVAVTMGPPAARDGLPVAAEREAGAGFETLGGRLPAVVTAAGDLAEERFPTKAERQAAAARPIVTLSAADVGLVPADIGGEGSPTWVAGIEPVSV